MPKLWAQSLAGTWHIVDASTGSAWAGCRVYALDRPIKLQGARVEQVPATGKRCKQCEALARR